MKKVRKRDGSLVDFDGSKICKAISKAYEEKGKQFDEAEWSKFVEDTFTADTETVFAVEEIQDKVQKAVITKDYNVGLAYILYRLQRQEMRLLAERESYIKKYIQSNSNASTDSEVDANANSTLKNVATLKGEVWKSKSIDLLRYILEKGMDHIFNQFKYEGKSLSEMYMADLRRRWIYKHDESSSNGIVMPYTYSSREVVNVLYNDQKYLLPMYQLFDLVGEEAVLVDEENDVYQKTPDNLFVVDVNGFTRVTKVTKKRRHRDLVRVKTAFGEDIVVTDNHPMITNKDRIEDTVQAKDVAGQQQYKVKESICFSGRKTIDLSTVFDDLFVSDSFVKTDKSVLKKEIELDEAFGYFVGFFVGDGNYDNTSSSLCITQKDRSVLDRLNDILFSHTGIAGKVYESEHNCFKLKISGSLFDIFRNYFHIDDKAQNKTLPIQFQEFNEEFALGLCEGLIDSDGTVNGTQLSVRLASRSAILQLTAILRYFGFSVGNTYQLSTNSFNSFNNNYNVWGVNTSVYENNIDMPMSLKFKKVLKSKSTPKYKNGYVNVISVTTLENSSRFVEEQNEYIYDISTETHSFVSNSILVHNCVAVNNYSFLQKGTSPLDGINGEDAPQSLESYVGQYCNMIFLISSQYLGAVADAGFFVAMNYYLVREFGEDYREHLDDVVYKTKTKQKTIKNKIIQTFQGIVYGINQPSSNRCNQSPFTNISYYDSNYFKALYADYYYPDGTKPAWEDIDLLQKMFMKWFNAERSRCLLTFPVETMALLTDGKDVIDNDYKNFTAEMYAEGHSFFTYMSDNADSLSSCCRLRNQLEKNTFSFTNGNIGVATGSKSVITINLNRVLQDFCNDNDGDRTIDWVRQNEGKLKEYLRTLLNRIYRYHYVFNEILWEEFEHGMLPVYSNGYISLNQQFLTIGINGLNEASMFYGLKCTPNDDYKYFCNLLLDTISESNRNGEKELQPLNPKHKIKFNTEFVPAEGLGVKNYNWDKEDGYWVPEGRNCYTSYFFLPDDPSNSVLDLMKLHGSEYASKCDGGMACHINLQENLSKSQYLALIDCAIANGTNYFTFNVPQTECLDCGHIEKKPFTTCPCCQSKNLRYWTRIIGYLRPINLFSAERMVEAGNRMLHNTPNGIVDSVPIKDI